jgi:hypothetical protein
LRFIADSITEVGSLVHIFPETIEWNLIVEFGKPFAPPVLSILVEIVWESGVNRPYLT